MKVRRDVGEISPHVELEGSLPGGAQENLAVITRLRDRGVETRRRVERAERVVGKAAAIGIQVCEGRHDDGRTGPEDAVLLWHELDLPYLIAQPGIRQRFEPVERLPILRTRDALEEVDGRKAARNN